MQLVLLLPNYRFARGVTYTICHTRQAATKAACIVYNGAVQYCYLQAPVQDIRLLYASCTQAIRLTESVIFWQAELAML